MCEYCGPLNGKHERIHPDLLDRFRERNRHLAAKHGMTVEEFVSNPDRLVSPRNRFLSWLKEGASITLQLLKPGL